MNLLNHRTTWTTWEFGLAKLGFILFGLVVGSRRPEAWRRYSGLLAALAALALIRPSALWIRSFRGH
jgi:NhaP-type Na+/H+ or K+/H+ antiporter